MKFELAAIVAALLAGPLTNTQAVDFLDLWAWILLVLAAVALAAIGLVQ